VLAYADKATVIAEVTAAAFKLAGESDILRNPADDHTKVVFDPAIRWHTDQFILKFVRP
jgi:predicted methyltransferase